MYKFHPELIRVKPSTHMNMSITNITDNDMTISAIFRSYNDTGYFYFTTEDENNHTCLSYKRDSEYSDIKLSFNVQFNENVLPWNDINNIQYLLIETYSGRTFPVALGFLGEHSEKVYEQCIFEESFYLKDHYIVWDSEQITINRNLAVKGIDYDINYITGEITRIESSIYPKNSEMHIYYKYHSKENYEIDFDNLFYSEKPNLENENYKVPSYDIKAVYFPVKPKNYDKDKALFSGLTNTGLLSFTNYKVKNGSLNMNNNLFEGIIMEQIIRENYDEVYYLNPAKVVKGIFNLGYKGKEIMLYLGSKNHFNYIGIRKTDNIKVDNYSFEINEKEPLNDCILIWLRNFFRVANELGYNNVIISFSPKLSFYPYDWVQEDIYGNPYNDNNSYPLAICNEEVINYYKLMCENILDIVSGYRTLTKICIEDLYFYNNKNNGLTVNDKVTQDNFKKEYGYSMREAENDIVILWLQNKINDFINTISNTIKQPKYLHCDLGLYIHVENVLDNNIHDFIKKINFPQAYLKRDFIIFDDSIWINSDTNNHNNVFKFAYESLGINIDDIYYSIINQSNTIYNTECQKAYDSRTVGNYIVGTGEYIRKNNISILNINLREEEIDEENKRDNSKWDNTVEEYFIRNMIFYGKNIFTHLKVRQISFYTDELKEFKEDGNGNLIE